ncbi:MULTISPECIES: plasmid partitioning/stability family protein [Enterobacterales]|uniref:plasmid partitioning/stability family protein n=1 Tax=Enterobacterales TaxID=91347 RepID=UPI0009499A14|nr:MULTISPECIES: plasmid partitioning/stability family protein [Enterobacterales]STA81054.1 Plasmid stability protein [Citrobacter koseri]STT20275.1 plasmid stable inheritance protein [Citrobacter koseri]
MSRRKILIYLRPETHASERFADARIEEHHRGDRGELSRTALLAGIALGEIDNRLPSVLAALLADNTSTETLRTMLVSFLNIQPGSRQPASVAATVPTSEVTEQPSSSVSAKNLAGSLPE